MTTEVVKTNSRGTLLERLGAKYLPDTPKAEVLSILQQTAFRTGKDQPPATPAQVAALLVVADQYGLNPWTKELFAFPDKQNGIVPVVGVDGWNRIANEHPQFAGETLELPPRDEWLKIDDDAKLAPPWMKVLVYRKDREHPTDHTEYLDECYREAFASKSGYKVKGAWQSHTKRMLEHKARIQARRIAFGFSGIYDQDEAERIAESRGFDVESTAVEEETGEVIGQAEYEAMLAEMERTQISLESIAKNVAAKAGYHGELADMPHPVWEALMTGLASMKTKTPPPPDNKPPTASPQPQDGADSPNEAPYPSEADSAENGASDEIAFTSDASDPEPPGMDAAGFAERNGAAGLFAASDPDRPASAGDRKALSEALAHVDAAAAKTYRARFDGRPNRQLTHAEAEQFRAWAVPK